MTGTPDWNLLPLFVTVTETASMSGASRKLGTPKSTVSRGIAALEASLGVQLFHRTTRNVALTTAGAAFYEKARPLVAAYRELAASLPEQEAEPSGELKLTVPIDMGMTFLLEALAQFALRYPSIKLNVQPSNRHVDLVGEGFDAALRVGPRLKDSTLVARKLGAIDSGAYVSPTYAAKRGTPRSLEECCTHDWVLSSGLKLPAAMRPAAPRVVTDDFLFARGMVRAGLGVGIFPAFLAQADIRSGHLLRVLPRWVLPGANLYFVHPAAQHIPRKVSALRDFMIELLAHAPLTLAQEP